jgi:hypothetical protein
MPNGAPAGTDPKSVVAREIEEVGLRGRYVEINYDLLDSVAEIMAANVESAWWAGFKDPPYCYQVDEAQVADDDAIMFHLVNGAQMWLIWEWTAEGQPEPLSITIDGVARVGAAAITGAHRRAIRAGKNLLDAQYLSTMTLDDVLEIYRDENRRETPIQNPAGRLAKFNELGRVLLDEFDGSAAEIYRRADGYLYREDGQGLVQTLHSRFPISFSDWPYLKLPQVSLYTLLGLRNSGVPATPEFLALTAFKDLDNIEGGADYYRPLSLMRIGLLTPKGDLKQALIDRRLIEDAEMESECRAATLVVMRELSRRLGKGNGVAMPQVELDTHATAFLKCRHCRVGISDEQLTCPYKRVCKAYNGDGGGERMSLGWPLVATTKY